MKDVQHFDGIKFTKDKQSGYYRHSTLRLLMHRYVWEYYNGKIPKGHEIHHIDFDRSNNDISNLQMLSRKEHRKLHADLLTDKQREWKRQNLEKKARPKAVEWHKSDDGKRWHKKHIKKMIDSGKLNRRYECVCVNCGKTFDGDVKSKYCCNNCKSAYRRLHGGDNVEMVCVVCGKNYDTNKFKPSKTCSRSCGSKLAWLENDNMGKKKG